jgi:tetratricopeptide (TPR) repeat protein
MIWQFDLTWKYYLVLILNLVYPWIIRLWGFKGPVSLWISVPLCFLALYVLTWAIDPLFLKRGEGHGFFRYVPALLWFYSPSVLSYGFLSRRALERARKAQELETEKVVKSNHQDDESEAKEALNRGISLMSRGKRQEAMKEFETILSYWPKAEAATLAASYITHLQDSEHRTPDA